MAPMAPYARPDGTWWMPLLCARALDMQQHWLLWAELPTVLEQGRCVVRLNVLNRSCTLRNLSPHLIPTPHLHTSSPHLIPTPHLHTSSPHLIPTPHPHTSSSHLIPTPHPHTSSPHLILTSHPHTLSPHLIPTPHPHTSSPHLIPNPSCIFELHVQCIW